MSHFITPIVVAAVSTLIFLALMARQIRSNLPDKLGAGMTLAGLWLCAAAGSLLYIAMRAPHKPVTIESPTRFAAVSGIILLLGIVTLALGLGVVAWRYSRRATGRIEEKLARSQRPRLADPPIAGDLASVPVPATRKAWNRPFRLAD